VLSNDFDIPNLSHVSQFAKSDGFKYCINKYKSLCAMEKNVLVGVDQKDSGDTEFKQMNEFVGDLSDRLKWYTSDGLPSYHAVKDMYLLDYEVFRSKYNVKAMLFREDVSNLSYVPDVSNLDKGETSLTYAGDDDDIDAIIAGATSAAPPGTYKKDVIGQTIGLSEEEKARLTKLRKLKYEKNAQLKVGLQKEQYDSKREAQPEYDNEPEYDNPLDEDDNNKVDDDNEPTDEDIDKQLDRDELRAIGWSDREIERGYQSQDESQEIEDLDDLYDVGKHDKFVYGD